MVRSAGFGRRGRPWHSCHALQEKGDPTDRAATYLAGRKANGRFAARGSRGVRLGDGQVPPAASPEGPGAGGRREVGRRPGSTWPSFSRSTPAIPGWARRWCSRPAFPSPRMEHGQCGPGPRGSRKTPFGKAAEMTAAREALERGPAATGRGRRKTPPANAKVMPGEGRDRQRRAEWPQWGTQRSRPSSAIITRPKPSRIPRIRSSRAMLAKAAREFDDIFQASRDSKVGVIRPSRRGKGRSPWNWATWNWPRTSSTRCWPDFETGGGVALYVRDGLALCPSQAVAAGNHRPGVPQDVHHRGPAVA